MRGRRRRRGKRPLWLEHSGKWEGRGVPRGQVTSHEPGQGVWISAWAVGAQSAGRTGGSEISWGKLCGAREGTLWGQRPGQPKRSPQRG